jgi:hypothetical protein
MYAPAWSENGQTRLQSKPLLKQFLDCSLDRPAALSGVLNNSCDFGQLRIFGQRHGESVSQALRNIMHVRSTTRAQKMPCSSSRPQDSLKKLSPEAVTATELAGEAITAKLTRAPGNNASIGGSYCAIVLGAQDASTANRAATGRRPNAKKCSRPASECR